MVEPKNGIRSSELDGAVAAKKTSKKCNFFVVIRSNDHSVFWQLFFEDSETQIMFKIPFQYSNHPDELIDLKRRKGDNYSTWKKLFKRKL